jgi:hypothetical protein
MSSTSYIFHLIVRLSVLEAIEFGEGHPAWDVYLNVVNGDALAAQRVRAGMVGGLFYKLIGATVGDTVDECLRTMTRSDVQCRATAPGDIIQIGTDFFLLTDAGYISLEGDDK